MGRWEGVGRGRDTGASVCADHLPSLGGLFQWVPQGEISTLSRVTTPGPQHFDSIHLKKCSCYILAKFYFLKISSNELIFLSSKANILLIFFVSITIIITIINVAFVFIL